MYNIRCSRGLGGLYQMLSNSLQRHLGCVSGEAPLWMAHTALGRATMWPEPPLSSSPLVLTCPLWKTSSRCELLLAPRSALAQAAVGAWHWRRSYQSSSRTRPQKQIDNMCVSLESGSGKAYTHRKCAQNLTEIQGMAEVALVDSVNHHNG